MCWIPSILTVRIRVTSIEQGLPLNLTEIPPVQKLTIWNCGTYIECNLIRYTNDLFILQDQKVVILTYPIQEQILNQNSYLKLWMCPVWMTVLPIPIDYPGGLTLMSFTDDIKMVDSFIVLIFSWLLRVWMNIAVVFVSNMWPFHWKRESLTHPLRFYTTSSLRQLHRTVFF